MVVRQRSAKDELTPDKRLCRYLEGGRIQTEHQDRPTDGHVLQPQLDRRGYAHRVDNQLTDAAASCDDRARAPSVIAWASLPGLTSWASTGTPRATSDRTIWRPCEPTPITRPEAGMWLPSRRRAASTTARGSTHTRSRSLDPGNAQAFALGTTSFSASAPARFMPTDWRRGQADVTPRAH